MTVVQLHSTPTQHDIVSGLRGLADKIEAGEIEEMPVITTALCLLGHTEVKHASDGSLEHSLDWELYTWGPRNDAFTVRGLIATVLKGH